MTGAQSMLVALAITLGALCGSGLRVVWTPSIPMGFYATEPLHVRLPTVGSYACLDPVHPRAPSVLREGLLYGELPRVWRNGMMKRVAAVAGDVVSLAEGSQGVAINGVTLPNSVSTERDSAGRRLPRPLYPVVLRSDEVWLASEHPQGFDSRYFGPVRIAALTCVGEPLWTW
jgi:conjugative transfer signal peptidase TraF